MGEQEEKERRETRSRREEREYILSVRLCVPSNTEVHQNSCSRKETLLLVLTEKR